MIAKGRKNSDLIFDMATTAVFAALSYVVTITVAIPMPMLNGAGYINLSDVFAFVIAALVNPWIGGLVGGISGMLSDLTLGYGYFAPFTLVIKFAEGVAAGYLFRALMSFGKDNYRQRLWKSSAAFAAGGILMAVLYMVPDFITYILTPAQVGNSYVFVFYDLLFNAIQGLVNAALGCAVYLGLYKFRGLYARHSELKQSYAMPADNRKDDAGAEQIKGDKNND